MTPTTTPTPSSTTTPAPAGTGGNGKPVQSTMESPPKPLSSNEEKGFPPPIVPEYVYPWAWLHCWGFGARGVKNLVKAGLRALKSGRLKFFRGRDLITVLEQSSDNHQSNEKSPADDQSRPG
jgi:hypothetical protein